MCKLSNNKQYPVDDMNEEYVLRFFFDWKADGCLWAGSDAALKRFGVGPIDHLLPLTQETIQRCKALSQWHDDSLNWSCPSHPSPWRQEECDRFNAAAQELLTTIRQELGERFVVLDKHYHLVEDPDLDRYLTDPNGFVQ